MATTPSPTHPPATPADRARRDFEHPLVKRYQEQQRRPGNRPR
jgi:hypothetical protein